MENPSEGKLTAVEEASKLELRGVSSRGGILPGMEVVDRWKTGSLVEGYLLGLQ